VATYVVAGLEGEKMGERNLSMGMECEEESVRIGGKIMMQIVANLVFLESIT
jgi:hypothetical protein